MKTVSIVSIRRRVALGVWPLFLGLVLNAMAADVAPVASSPPPAVRVVPVAFSRAAIPITVPGVLARRTEVDLAFKIAGVVDRVSVRSGDRVTKGQELARLQLDEIDAQAAQAASAVAKARRDLERVTTLRERAVATLENLQDARTALEVAEAQLRAVTFNRAHAVIVAPADGRVLRRAAEPGEVVTSGRVVLSVASDDDGWIARAGVSTDDAARLRLGDRAEVAGLEGVITQLPEATEVATRTVVVEVALAQAPVSARSGVVVTVALRPSGVAERAVVPLAALVEGDGGRAALFLVDGEPTVARRRVVEVEAFHGTDAYLRTPLPAGAQVVAQGGEFLRDGGVVLVAK